MKMSVLFFGILIITLSCSSNKFKETEQGNLFVRNQRVYYQKSYPSALSISSAEQELKLLNTPYGGLQIKQVSDSLIHGVIVNYQLNWDVSQGRGKKIPDIVKQPVNATFEIERRQSNYTVTVSNIWFAAMKVKTNVTLESLVLKNDGCCFKHDKGNIEMLDMMDKNFTAIFQIKNKDGGLRF